jgi:hypothetical protein
MHHQHLKSTKARAPERGDQAGRPHRAAQRVPLPPRSLPDAEGCLRLILALAVAMHENWPEARRHLNMDDLREHKREALPMAA